jgi:glycosyltransferase involved in cell wall biosynthesis
MPKTLLWLTDNFPPQRGGMAQSCDRIVYSLRKADYQIHVAHFVPEGQEEKYTDWQNGSYQSISYLGSEGHTLNVAWHLIHKDRSFEGVVSFGGYLSMLALPVYSAWLQVPGHLLLRGNDFDQGIFSPRKKIVLDAAVEASRQIGVVSADKAERVAKIYPKSKVMATLNGIDLSSWSVADSFRKEAENWRALVLGSKKCIGLFGDLKAKKGVDYFIEAVLPFYNSYHLLLVGAISEAVLNKLQNNRISYTLMPFLDRYELLPKYLYCDLIAIPSWYDGLPNVLLEAGALGIPCLSSAVDGMKDVLNFLEKPWTFPPGDVDECKNLLYLISKMDNQALQQAGKALQDVVHTHFNLNSERQSYEKLFDY